VASKLIRYGLCSVGKRSRVLMSRTVKGFWQYAIGKIFLLHKIAAK
jgi:hypothetical protein